MLEVSKMDFGELEERMARLVELCPAEDVVCAAAADGAARRRWLRRLRECGFPAQYCEEVLRLNDGAPSGSVRAAERLYDGMRRVAGKGCLWLLSGKRGTGKTVAVCRLARDGGYSKCWYFSGDELYREKLARAEEGYGGEVVWRRDVCGREGSLLVLDEAQRWVDDGDERRRLAVEFFEDVINRRLDAGVDTVVVGNWDEDGLARAVPDSVVSRLNGARRVGRGGVVFCSWGGMR